MTETSLVVRRARSSTSGDVILPVFLNPGAGTAADAADAVSARPRLALRELAPQAMRTAIAEEVSRGASRIVVAGGDGTVALAASLTVGTATELAVVPAGTLNHFARRHGIPTRAADALDCALEGQVRRVDVGWVNDRLFINTSSVGAYVDFVRTRTALQRRMGYYSASLVAGAYRLLRLHSPRLRLDARELRTPLVLLAIGERELRYPLLGDCLPGGGEGLHVIAVRHHRWFDALRLALFAVVKGLGPLDRENLVDSQLVEEVTLAPARPRRQLSLTLDGEPMRLTPPLRYRRERAA